MAVPTASAAPTRSAAATDKKRALRDVMVCSLIMSTTLLSLWCAGHALRAGLWRWQRRFLQHVLELRIHRLGAAVDTDKRNLMAAGVLFLEGMLIRQVGGDVAFWTIRDLEHRVADPEPCARGKLSRAAHEVLA